MSLAPAAGILLAALLIEPLVGYPDRLFRVAGHPVSWIGAAIGLLDRKLNRPALPDGARQARGAGAIAVIVVATAVVGGAAQIAWLGLPLAVTLLAQRSLADHVAAVGQGLAREGLAGGRAAVGHIVGRNPAFLDEAGVARAAIESLAENFSDGVVAPALWCALLGLPGMLAYKAINTADSMIGHRTPATRRVRLGIGAAGRPGQPAGGAAGRPVHRPGGRAAPRCLGAAGVADDAARRAPAPLTKRRLAGGGDGRGARAKVERAAGLRS